MKETIEFKPVTKTLLSKESGINRVTLDKFIINYPRAYKLMEKGLIAETLLKDEVVDSLTKQNKEKI